MTLILHDGQAVPRASWRRRLAAGLMDLFLRAVALVVALGLLYASLPPIRLVHPQEPMCNIACESPMQWVTLTGAIMIFLSVLAYEPVMSAVCRRTIGRAIVGIGVVSHSNGQRPLLSQTVVRWLVPVVVGCIGAVIGVICLNMSIGISPLSGDIRRPTFLALSILVAQIQMHLSSIWDSDGRGWHDKAAGTIIIQTRW